jgi:hypothetical protein
VTKSTVHHLRDHLKEIYSATPRPWEIWPEGKPFGTPDDYCREVTGHSWRALLAIVEELTGEATITGPQMRAELARAQVEHRPQGKHSPLYDNGETMQGTGSQYLLRRLARDHADILARYETGEFPSVRAAAREAGIVKDAKPFDQIKKLLPKLTDAERRQLKDLL